MRRPAPLQKGDKIGLIAASSSVPPDKLQPAINAMKGFGFVAEVGESCRQKHGFLAGTDSVRANDVNKMFADKSIKGVFCIRGGYGSQRILDLIDFDIIRENPKLFCGYSDVTALHIAINQKCGLITYHTPMASTEIYKTLDDYTLNYYNKCIYKNAPLGNIENPVGQDIVFMTEGKCRGILTGGNLSLISSSIGTPYEIDTKGKIIFIEEVEEEPYKIDRMLLQMKLAGKFDDCAGVVFGAFTKCKAEYPDKSLDIMTLINELIGGKRKPIIYNLQCGHCLPTLSLPLGAEAIIDATQKSFTVF